MLSTAETNAAAAAATATASSTTTEVEVDGDAFVRALQEQMGSGVDQDKIKQAMDKLASAFPTTTLTSETFGSFESTSSFFLEVNGSTTISISPEIMEQVADDPDAFDRIANMIGSLFSAGADQNMVQTSGSVSQRGVLVDGDFTRYVEVQRDDSGKALSMISLALETQKMLAETTNQLLSLIGGKNTSSTNSIGSFFTMNTSLQNMTGGMMSSSGNGQQSIFNLLTSTTTTWQMQGLLTRDTAAEAQLASSQSAMTSMEVIIEQWEADGGAGKMDLFTYMEVMGLCDPLVFDLGDEGINLTSAEDGVYFDIKGDGTPVKTGWISGNNAFLYLDENGNGVADDASELFGDHGGFANGFEKLAQYDDNGDGVIDENDEIYSQLRLWRDLNSDGINQADESLTLAEAGIKSINLRHDNSKTLDQHGNVIADRSSFTRFDGSRGQVADAWFRTL